MSDEIRFTVRRLGWHQNPHGDHYTRRLPTAQPVATFDNFDDAEYHRRARESEARAGENPFRFGGETLYFQSCLDAPRLHDWLLDMGIDPPTTQLRHRDWREWWDAFAHTWSEEQLAHAWQGLDKVRFFDVEQVSGSEPLHAIMEVRFVNRDYRSLKADREGGRVVRVYRRPRVAKSECDRLNRIRQQAREYQGHYYVEHRTRVGYENDREEYRRVEDSVFYELTELRGIVPVHAGLGYLVQRCAFDANGWVCMDGGFRDTGSRVPLLIFATRAEAETYRDALTVEVQQIVNPFQSLPILRTRLTRQVVRECLQALGVSLPLPPYTHANAEWREWWDLCQDEMTPEQRNTAWELFEYPLFEVRSVEMNDE
jgi:hypothetical protein